MNKFPEGRLEQERVMVLGRRKHWDRNHLSGEALYPRSKSIRIPSERKGAEASSQSSISLWLCTFLTCPTKAPTIISWTGSVSISVLGIYCSLFLRQDPNVFFAESRFILWLNVFVLNHRDMWPKQCLPYNRMQQHLDHPGQLNKEELDTIIPKTSAEV